jgi:hypothetical protein
MPPVPARYGGSFFESLRGGTVADPDDKKVAGTAVLPLLILLALLLTLGIGTHSSASGIGDLPPPGTPAAEGPLWPAGR